ncbi:MAG TPA: hypothetical protein VHN11_01555 [Xanthobacteraceae bacterium]|jgi:hypothetical protein|nr:hypothetical protein [Xanthobacteraceae bacterium]
MNENKCVFVYGPQGSGKSRHGEALRKHFGLPRIVDGWSPTDELPRTGALVLTNVDLSRAPECHLWRRAYSIKQALELLDTKPQQAPRTKPQTDR